MTFDCLLIGEKTMKTLITIIRSVVALVGAAGRWSLDISRQALPKGELRIARQFTAGFESEIAQVPKGRLNPFMSYVSSYSHCVFSTKDRRPCLTTQLRDRLWPFLGGIAREHQMKALSIGGVEDHVHLLLSLPATMSIAKAMQLIKGGSSKWVHDSFPDQRLFAWQTKYGAFSVSVSQLDRIIKYIENQQRHHRRMTFQEEFIALLKRHKIEYDERYLWE